MIEIRDSRKLNVQPSGFKIIEIDTDYPLYDPMASSG